MKLNELYEKVKRFNNPQFISDLINQAIIIHEKQIVNLNTNDQIFNKGIKATGEKIKPTGKPYPIYSAQYELRKRKAGKYQGHVDLKWSGRYLKSYNIIPEFQKFLLESKDVILAKGFNLSEHLKSYYTKEIEGLTNENMKIVAKIIRPTLIKLYRNALIE